LTSWESVIYNKNRFARPEKWNKLTHHLHNDIKPLNKYIVTINNTTIEIVNNEHLYKGKLAGKTNWPVMSASMDIGELSSN